MVVDEVLCDRRGAWRPRGSIETGKKILGLPALVRLPRGSLVGSVPHRHAKNSVPMGLRQLSGLRRRPGALLRHGLRLTIVCVICMVGLLPTRGSRLVTLGKPLLGFGERWVSRCGGRTRQKRVAHAAIDRPHVVRVA